MYHEFGIYSYVYAYEIIMDFVDIAMKCLIIIKPLTFHAFLTQANAS